MHLIRVRMVGEEFRTGTVYEPIRPHSNLYGEVFIQEFLPEAGYNKYEDSAAATL